MAHPSLPYSLLTKLRTARPAFIAGRLSPNELDTPESVARAIEYLKNRAPHAIAGAGGNSTTYGIVCWIRDLNISRGKCLDLMIEHWNEEKAHPNWDYEELSVIVGNAYKYAQNAPGSRSAHSDFEPVTLAGSGTMAPARQVKPKLYAISFAEAVTQSLIKTAEPLIKEFLDCGASSVVYGESNSGKTFVAIDVSLHVATGKSWNGRKTKHGRVAYVACEGGRGIYKRLDAWCRYHNIDPADVKMVLIPCPVDLRSLQGDTAPLIELIKQEAEETFGQPIDLVVIDTLSRALAGGDENSPIDMGLIVRNCDRIRDALKCHVMLVHHSGKNKSAGARGHSLLRAATDTEIEIDKRTILTKKQRDMEPARDLRFDLKRVDLGNDEDGNLVSSCAVEIRTAGEFEKLPLDPQSEMMLEAVARGAREIAAARGSPDDWKSMPVGTALCDKHYQEINSAASGVAIGAAIRGQSPRTLRRLRQCLVECGHLKKVSSDQWVLV